LIPTGIMAAWKADFVKLFPCAVLGGADYIRTEAMRGYLREA